MSVDVGDAVWTIKGDTKPIENALQQGTARVKSATDNIVANTRKIGIGMVAVGTVVTGAIAGLISNYTKAGDEIQKMALRTGFSTEKLSELKHAAELGGTSLSVVEKGIKQVSRVIYEAGDESKKAAEKQAAASQKGAAAIQNAERAVTQARMAGNQAIQQAINRGANHAQVQQIQAQHAEKVRKASEKVAQVRQKVSLATQKSTQASGTYTDALNALGLSQAKLMDMSPEDRFMEVAYALADVKDAGTKAALATELFGRAGMDMLPMLAEGREGIKRAAESARELGLVFDQDAANAAAQFQDNMLELKRSLQGAGFAIAEDLVPWLNQLIPKVTEAIKAGIQWIRANQGTITTIAKIAFQLGPVLVALGTLLIAVPKVIGVFKGITAVAGFFKTGFALILAGGPVTIAIAAVAAAAMLIIANWEKLGPFFSDLWSALVDTVENAADAIYYALRFPYDLVVGLIEKLGSLMGFDWTGIPGGFDFGQYQSGGIIKEPFALVGEHGPELITGAQGARVHSASDTAQMLKGGGGTTIEHIEINVDTGGAPVNADRLASELEYALGRRLATVGVTA